MAFDRTRLHTVQLIPITAFDRDGRLNLAPMRTLFERVVGAGIRVLIPCAGTAEFHSLSDDEIVSVVSLAREVMGAEGVVTVPIGQRLDGAIELGNRAAAAGACTALVMPLSFPYLANEGARDYYLRILDELDVPVMIYKKAAIPSDDLLLELAEHANLIGVKYAENDMEAFNHVVARDGGRIDWFCGSAERYAPFFALAGAPGYTSGAGIICPRVTLAMHRAMVDNDWPRAMELQRILLPIERFRGRDNNSFNVTFLKYAVRQLGLDFGEPRPPQRRATAAEREEIDRVIPPIVAAEEQLAETTAVGGS